MQNINRQIVAIDVETSGIEPGSRMVELGAIHFNNDGPIAHFSELVNPGMPMPEDVTKIHGITNDMVADKPGAEKVLREFFDWLPYNDLVAHNAGYDTGIISWEAARHDIEIPEELMVFDTLMIAKFLKKTKNNKLDTLSNFYELKRVGKQHRALSDAHLCGEYFNLMHHHVNQNRHLLRPLPWADAGHDYSYTDEFPEQLSVLPKLVEKAEPLNFAYKDAKDEVTERTITPYGHALTSSGLMFHGWCHMRKARRTFRADRVVRVHEQQVLERDVA